MLYVAAAVVILALAPFALATFIVLLPYALTLAGLMLAGAVVLDTLTQPKGAGVGELAMAGIAAGLMGLGVWIIDRRGW